MTNIIQRLEKNTVGIDYAVGDIHGEFHLVDEALYHAKFNPNMDRLICVGDLIDRGRYSNLVYEFLSRPYVYSVRGNHEDDLIKINLNYLDVDMDVFNNFLISQGFGWWVDLTDDLKEKTLSKLLELPYIIEVPTDNGMVGFVHAQPLADKTWEEFKQLVEASDSEALTKALWGRELALGKSISNLTDIFRVYSGHTPKPDGVCRFLNYCCIDTAAVFAAAGNNKRGHLSIVKIDVSESVFDCGRKRSDLIEIIK